jgi:methylphosphotriester-DNA--protein-cysteine methyltransferase
LLRTTRRWKPRCRASVRPCRSARRSGLRATGLSQSTLRQIERARYATRLLRRGVSILDTVHESGFFDQAHLGRALRRMTGQTPAGIARADAQLSYLYNTARDP